MGVDYRRYLAENVLNEGKTVTYRLLSRALRIHSHLAKQMLYDFHRTENAKKPNSVNATYLISGIRRPPEPPARTDGDDTVMQSSPYMSSLPQPDETERPVRAVSYVLAREEDLEDAKATFESISVIHIYSLQPTKLQDLNVLLDVGREITASYGHEDPLELGKVWGMIQNQNAKRQKGARPPPPPPPTAAPGAASRPAIAAKPSIKKEKSQPKTESESESSVKQPAQKRKGDIFSSFAKAKAKPKTEDSAAPSESESAKASAPEEPMFDDDDPDDEGEDLFPDTGKPKTSEPRETRQEREEKLRKMMEDDDEDMPDAPTDVPSEAPSKDPEPAGKPEPQEPKEHVVVENGRRRGKRKVMKKMMMKDEEGYLVTVEEPVWESFSEEEPAPPPKKKPFTSGNAPKGKKGGQGNIMSFFSKKT
ncbi:hypothetical protein VTN31DRAFT_6597 [Thermomyces dupontii]|uniref:uncharacterized protein n=1 Tax=Talaromyces thermophilus TaxID=28565 RepID=UPI0037422354